ncbi:MAG: hypothetical protein LBB63_00735 [Holosporaceae bacterium]|nr:hypothetical protein [Holosporaceae bacterium]
MKKTILLSRALLLGYAMLGGDACSMTWDTNDRYYQDMMRYRENMYGANSTENVGKSYLVMALFNEVYGTAVATDRDTLVQRAVNAATRLPNDESAEYLDGIASAIDIAVGAYTIENVELHDNIMSDISAAFLVINGYQSLAGAVACYKWGRF